MTLLELMLTLTIIMVLLLVAVPITSDFIQRNQLSVATNKILSMVNFARTQALSAEQSVMLIPYSTTTSGHENWSEGMLLFKDNNNNHHYETSDELLQVWQSPNSGVSIVWQGFVSDHYLEFPGDGVNGAVSGTFTLCTPHTHEGKAVVINRLGRARIENASTC